MSISTWTIYLNTRRQTNSSNEEFRNSLQSVGTLATFKAFECTWRLSVQSQFSSGSVRVFKDDITPMWEHPANQGGGTLLTNVSVADRHSYEAFLSVMEGLMTDNIEHGELINGIVLAYRAWGYTMSMWLREGVSAAARAELISCIEELTHDDTLKFSWKLHDEHQAAIEKRRQSDREQAREQVQDQVRVHRKTFGPKFEKPRLEKADYRKSQRTIVHPENLHLQSSELNTTKVRGRRVAAPKYTIADLESKWNKEYDLQQQQQAWTVREVLWAVGMFAASAFFVSQMSTAAF